MDSWHSRHLLNRIVLQTNASALSGILLSQQAASPTAALYQQLHCLKQFALQSFSAWHPDTQQ